MSEGYKTGLVDDAYGKSDVTLRIEIEGGVGEIRLGVAEAPPFV